MPKDRASKPVQPALRSRKSPQGSPTVQDVARLAKVSVGSVSRVLNGRENVAPAIQEAVRAAVAELNFVPNVVARSMRKGSSGAIGCLISDITQHTAAQMVSAAEERLRAENEDEAYVEVCESAGCCPAGLLDGALVGD